MVIYNVLTLLSDSNSPNSFAKAALGERNPGCILSWLEESSVSTPTASPLPTNPSSPPTPSRWPLWLALVLQWGVVALVATGLIVAKSTSNALDGAAAASIGLAVVIVGLVGTVALVIASLAGSPKQAANFVLMGMFVRLSVPLAALLVVPKRWPGLAEAGFRDQVLILYLAALVVETYAAIRVTGMPPPRFASK
jgi:hypothetical protein